ncbi:unnamed protein product, partial [Heterotrigona itama]
KAYGRLLTHGVTSRGSTTREWLDRNRLISLLWYQFEEK